MGDLGLGDGRLYNHMSLQPVVHLDAGGQSAKGRWRVIAMIGQYGRSAVWAEGVYEMGYAKDHGVWKIRTLDYYSDFGAPYRTGWVPPPAPAAGSSSSSGSASSRSAAPARVLAHPADRPRKMDCEGFPAACVAPFHYENPGTSGAARAWTVSNEMIQPLRGDARKVLADLSQRATRLRDEEEIENLQRIYGYYLDRAMWDQVADLFARDGTIEMGQQGVYIGQARIRQFLALSGEQGLATGQMNDHLQLQTLVDVALDGKTAYGRSRELAMTGMLQQSGTWSEGVYENTFVKEKGVWRIKSLHFYPTVITDYEKGWADDAQPVPGMSTTLPPDRPPTEVYAIYPKAYVPPYHYRNAVTGEPPHYPKVGGPDPGHAAAALMPVQKQAHPTPVKDIEGVLSAAEREIDRARDYDEVENLEGAYGYYLDKNLWNPLADLFSRDGSIELAQRGVYRGQDHVRAFLLKVFGRGQEGPVAGRLGNHIQVQPVIDIAPDGQTAKVRVRLLQQMSLGGRASLGGAVYENEAVKEDGVWKFKVDHAYNTFSAAYSGGWTKGASTAMPGPSADFPPDGPPTAVITMFPAVYDIPFHYANPVSGRTEVPPLRLAAAAPPGMSASIAAALREIGARIDGQRTTALYGPLFPADSPADVSVARDVAYGPYERNGLDVFTVSSSGAPKPVLVFIHGGGFTRGAKHTSGSPFYDNVGVWAARNGLVGVTINYRLAPQSRWPSGIEDLTALVGWLQKHAAQYGGDPQRIFLWGHSSGAAHVADYIAHQVSTGHDSALAGAVLTSGFYDLGKQVSVWKDYYGEDVTQYPERSSLPGLLKTTTPLLVTYAELDPDSFKEQAHALIDARSAAGKPVPVVLLPGHSHLSETYAVGSPDESLSAPVLRFVRGPTMQVRP
jgi:triacylglycerol lipase